jgi:hypothetical protein
LPTSSAVSGATAVYAIEKVVRFRIYAWPIREKSRLKLSLDLLNTMSAPWSESLIRVDMQDLPAFPKPKYASVADNPDAFALLRRTSML